jgi:energy-coupling factor transporter ATP-binding protein EcfA2
LYAKIVGLDTSLENTLADPKTITRLPFPFLGETPSRFNPGDEDGLFAFMGRGGLTALLAQVSELRLAKTRKLLLHGTAGFGKSHIVAALVCLLIKQGRLVLYLPDCKVMLQDRVDYLRAALRLTFHGDEGVQRELLEADEKGLLDRCKWTKDLVFVVDQLNALDISPGGDDLQDKKSDCCDLINSASFGHLIIQAASANNQTSQKVGDQQVRQIVLKWFGGFPKVRCSLLPCCLVLLAFVSCCLTVDQPPLSGRVRGVARPQRRPAAQDGRGAAAPNGGRDRLYPAVPERATHP